MGNVGCLHMHLVVHADAKEAFHVVSTNHGHGIQFEDDIAWLGLRSQSVVQGR